MRKRVRLIAFVLGVLVLLLGGAYLILALPAPRVCPGAVAAQASGAWNRGPDMPSDRSEIAAAALEGKVYVGGGLRLTGASNAFEVYDPGADSWQQATDLPRALHHFALVALGDRLYLTGGYEGNNLSQGTDAMWIYDPAADQWSAGPPMPGARAAHAAAALDGKLYVVGGAGVGSTFIWVYDPASRAWETLPAMMPTAREHLAAVALDSEIYAIGGRRPDVGNLATLEIFNPATGQWTAGPPMPTARGGLTAASLNGRLHVTGGEDFNRSPSCTFSHHEIYDPAQGTWTSLAPLPTPRHGLTSATVNGRWHVIGGGTKASALTLVSSTARVETFSLIE